MPCGVWLVGTNECEGQIHNFGGGFMFCCDTIRTVGVSTKEAQGRNRYFVFDLDVESTGWVLEPDPRV